MIKKREDNIAIKLKIRTSISLFCTYQLITVNSYFPLFVSLQQLWSGVIFLAPDPKAHTALMTLNGRTLNRKTTILENYMCVYVYMYMSITRRSRWLTCGTQKWNSPRERKRERKRKKKNRWPPRSFGKANTSSRYRRISVFRNSSAA